MLLIFASTAIEDLDDLWDWVGADSPDAADRRLAGIRETCLRLADHPHLGRARDELMPGLRSLVHGRYVIFNRVHEQAVQILRVIDGRRDQATSF